MRVHLINEIVRRGYLVDLVATAMNSPYLDIMSPEVRTVRVATSNSVTGIPGLAYYLFRARPRVVLSQRLRVNLLALRARGLVRADTRVYTTLNTTMSGKLDDDKPHKRERHLNQLRDTLKRNDGIIAVSRGVAEDAARLVGIALERIRVAPNPTVTPELAERAGAPLDHPWFAAGAPPVVLGVGRLTHEKDFSTLVRAFARVRSAVPCRLLILGEGPKRSELESLIADLHLSDDAALPGFVSNPYSFMARAGVFVLSSRREGSPNALTEALAVGAPLVATDCPSGPREILEGGRHGLLVPVGDVDMLADAISQTLRHPPADRAARQAAAQRYTVERSATAYIEALELGTSAP